MILTLAVSGYRSLRDLTLPLEQLTVITGANGSGKSSLYRAINLLAGLAQGNAIRALAREGGLQSTLWAGPEKISKSVREGEHPVQGTVRQGRMRLLLGFASDDYGYAADLGLPQPSRSLFSLDPSIKAEAVWVGEYLRRTNIVAKRRGPSIELTDLKGRLINVMSGLSTFDSMMTYAADPSQGAELLAVRERMRGWRFYDQLRTDRDAPARQMQIGTQTVSLASDGSDLVSAVQTLLEIGDHDGFETAIDDAFPEARIEIREERGKFELYMHQKGLLRALNAAELSDGTLRYIMLVTALLTPRPPELLVLNEPETSLHPNLFLPLARLIDQAANRVQIILVSHAAELVDYFSDREKCASYELSKDFGETVARFRNGEIPNVKWEWPER